MAHPNDRGGVGMKAQAQSQLRQSYQWPVPVAAYDRSVALTTAEEELEFLVPRDGKLE